MYEGSRDINDTALLKRPNLPATSVSAENCAFSAAKTLC